MISGELTWMWCANSLAYHGRGLCDDCGRKGRKQSACKHVTVSLLIIIIAYSIYEGEFGCNHLRKTHLDVACGLGGLSRARLL
jgi:hypothetical protein